VTYRRLQRIVAIIGPDKADVEFIEKQLTLFDWMQWCRIHLPWTGPRNKSEKLIASSYARALGKLEKRFNKLAEAYKNGRHPRHAKAVLEAEVLSGAAPGLFAWVGQDNDLPAFGTHAYQPSTDFKLRTYDFKVVCLCRQGQSVTVSDFAEFVESKLAPFLIDKRRRAASRCVEPWEEDLRIVSVAPVPGVKHWRQCLESQTRRALGHPKPSDIRFVRKHDAVRTAASILKAHGLPLTATRKAGTRKASAFCQVTAIVTGDRDVYHQCRQFLKERKQTKTRNRGSK